MITPSLSFEKTSNTILEGRFFTSKRRPSHNEGEASPPTPLRMERGVKTTICKQRGRSFTSKKRLSHNEGTPSSNEGGRSFRFINYIVSLETNCTLIVFKYSFAI